MYFKEKENTNIDSEFNGNKFDIKKYKMPLIILGIIVILIIGIIILINTGVFKKEINYFLTLEGEELITIYKGNEYVDPGYIGRDSLGNDLTDKVVVSSNIDTSITDDIGGLPTQFYRYVDDNGENIGGNIYLNDEITNTGIFSSTLKLFRVRSRNPDVYSSLTINETAQKTKVEKQDNGTYMVVTQIDDKTREYKFIDADGNRVLPDGTPIK